ncbi:MAG TPA: PLP-dependent aminotransferase family protein [Pseudolabrys sp.]|nr:PLP-dependent aminotransferase family protein [Pseudolabrys sp.]
MANGQKHLRQAIEPSAFRISLSKGNGRPLFMQLHEQIVDRIAAGELTAGARLPPVRRLAQQLGINHMTVAKAYKDLAEAGFVEGRAGGGTHVRAPYGTGSRRGRGSEPQSAGPLLSERLYELSRAPGVISFTTNYPAPDSECAKEFETCLQSVVADGLSPYFAYDPPNGRIGFRRAIAEYLARGGLTAAPEDVIVTSGAQQAIDLVVRLLVPHGSPVIVERPSYYGVINALRGVGARILEVPLEADGMEIEKLEAHLARHRPRLIYTNPTFQNPTGVTTSIEKRRSILALARKHGVAILEDDHNSELRFSGSPVPSIRSLSEPGDNVFFVRGFGKVFLPGTRLGYVVAPPHARRPLLALKAHSDLHTTGIMQEAMARFLTRKNYPKFLERMKRAYAAKQRKVISSLTAGMPPGTLIGNPDGGLSLWVTLPEGTEVSELYYRAVRRGVAFVAGEVFYASHVNARTLRVSFGLLGDDVLEEGVARLCSVAKDLMRPRSAPSPIYT